MSSRSRNFENQLATIQEELETIKNRNQNSNGNQASFSMAKPENMKIEIPEEARKKINESKNIDVVTKELPNPIGLPKEWLYLAEVLHCGVSDEGLKKISQAFKDAMRSPFAKESQWPRRRERARLEDFERAFKFINSAVKNANLSEAERVTGALVFMRRYAELSNDERNYQVEETIHWSLRYGPKNFREVRDWFIRRNHGGEVRDRRVNYKALKIRPDQTLQQFMEVITDHRAKLPQEDKGTVEDMFTKVESSTTSHNWDTFESTLLQLIASRRAERNQANQKLDEADWENIYREARKNNTQWEGGSNRPKPAQRKRARETNKEKPKKSVRFENNKEENTNNSYKNNGNKRVAYNCKLHGQNRTHNTEQCYTLQKLEKRKQDKKEVAAMIGTDTIGSLQDEIDQISVSSD